MQKYARLMLIAIIAIAFGWLIVITYPTQSRILDGYREQISTLSGEIQKGIAETEKNNAEIARLQQHNSDISRSNEEKKQRIETLRLAITTILCIESKECETGDKQAMFSIVNTASAKSNNGTVTPAISGVPLGVNGKLHTGAVTPKPSQIEKKQPSIAENVKEKERILSPETSKYWEAYNHAIPMIQKYEGLRLTAYWDYRACSIGYGNRAKNCKEKITKAEADRRLADTVKQLVTRVQKDFPNLSAKKQSALVSFSFNCSAGYRDVVRRGLSKHGLWCKTAGGERLRGLVNRRAEESKILFSK